MGACAHNTTREWLTPGREEVHPIHGYHHTSERQSKRKAVTHNDMQNRKRRAKKTKLRKTQEESEFERKGEGKMTKRRKKHSLSVIRNMVMRQRLTSFGKNVALQVGKEERAWESARLPES